MERAEISDETRRELLAFLSNTVPQRYVPLSGGFIGILQEMKDGMAMSLTVAAANSKMATATQIARGS